MLVNDILFAGDYEEEVQATVNHQYDRYEGIDLGVLDRFIVVALMVEN